MAAYPESARGIIFVGRHPAEVHPLSASEPDCTTCGACCLRAFDALDLVPGEPFCTRHSALVVVDYGRLQMQRRGDRCPLLNGDGSDDLPFRCTDYDHRPQTCRDLEVGSVACHQARELLSVRAQHQEPADEQSP